MPDGNAQIDVLNTTAQSQLKAIIERVERLNEDKAAVTADIAEVYGEAKGNGYSVPILRQIVKLRAMDAAKRSEAEAILDLYVSALGGL